MKLSGEKEVLVRILRNVEMELWGVGDSEKARMSVLEMKTSGFG